MYIRPYDHVAVLRFLRSLLDHEVSPNGSFL